MQLTTLVFALGGLSMAVAAPQAALAGRAPQDNLLVTFWKNGCGQTGVGNSKTFVVNAQDGPSKPEACETNGLYNLYVIPLCEL